MRSASVAAKTLSCAITSVAATATDNRRGSLPWMRVLAEFAACCTFGTSESSATVKVNPRVDQKLQATGLVGAAANGSDA